MHILDILENFLPSRQQVNINRKLDGNKDIDPRNKIGMGHFSVVRSDKNDPNKIKKYNHIFDERDPFISYIEFIIDNNATTNPWFPKIYNIKTITDPDGKTSNKFSMEKLYNGNDLDVDQIKNVIFATLDKDSANNLISSGLSKDELNFYGNNPSRAIHSLFSKHLNKALMSNYISDIKDENLKSAIFLLRKLKSSDPDIMFDLQNPTNLMYRIEDNNIHPVMNDPIA